MIDKKVNNQMLNLNINELIFETDLLCESIDLNKDSNENKKVLENINRLRKIKFDI